MSDDDRFLSPDLLPAVLEGWILSSWTDPHCCGEDHHQVDARHCATCGGVTCWRSGAGPGGSSPPECYRCGTIETRTQISGSEHRLPRADLVAALRDAGAR